ncbi:MAG TPA: polysaccharide deacetylase family protein [Anaerolineales bacterium]|nr:polysaccharide deacetylase family protein [Anaerolineales bacterium]
MNRFNALLRMATPLLRPIYAGAGVILMFHRILPADARPRLPGPAALEITPEMLERTITFFAKRGYVVFSPDDLHQFLVGEKRIDRPFVLFTFDDGYADNLTYAYPIFKKYNIPFSIYVSTCFPERTAVIWWYLLEDLILQRKRIEFEHEGRLYEFPCGTHDEKAATFAALRAMFKFANVTQRAALTQSILYTHKVDVLRKVDEIALTWKQLRELASDPLVTLGAHTANHYVLSVLADHEVVFEIAESKRLLENHLERGVDHFAYPFGNRREAGKREFRIAAECGFKTAMTTRFGNIFRAHASHLTALPRCDTAQFSVPHALDLVASGMLSARLNRLRRIVTE